MPAPHAVLLTLSDEGKRPVWSYRYTGTLPRLISFVSHSYENTGGVGVFFPFRLSLRSAQGFIPPAPTDLPRSYREDPDPVGTLSGPLLTLLLSLLAATLMKLPASVANKRLTPRLNPLDATLTKNKGAPYRLAECRKSSSTGVAMISRTRSRSAGTSSFVKPLVSMVSCR